MLGAADTVGEAEVGAVEGATERVGTGVVVVLLPDPFAFCDKPASGAALGGPNDVNGDATGENVNH